MLGAVVLGNNQPHVFTPVNKLEPARSDVLIGCRQEIGRQAICSLDPDWT